MQGSSAAGGRESGFPPGLTSVAGLDHEGRITGCNPGFLEASGFDRDEVIGRPHEFLRHPDMPDEVYRDLRASISTGGAWSGLLKDRRSDGLGCWALVHVLPVRHDGGVTGFVAIRSRPSRPAVAQAERAYTQMGGAGGAAASRARLALRGGEVVGRHAACRIVLALRPTLRGLILAASGVAVAVAAVSATWLPVGMAVPAVALSALVLAWSLDRLVAGALRPAISQARRLAAGDLPEPGWAPTRGPVGELDRAIARLSARVRALVGDGREQVRGMQDAMHESVARHQDLSLRTEAQSQALAQAGSVLGALRTTAQRTEVAAQRGTQLATETTTAARHSHEALLGLVRAMQEIRESSERIVEVIAVVESVAFQTNILALNAAVEAARAGAAGAGFTIVAGEVRALATRTADATAEIRRRIVADAEHVASGDRHAIVARHRMDEGLQAVERVGRVLGDIEQAVGEQHRGLSDIGESVANLETLTAQNVQMVETLNATTLSTAGRIDAMTDTMRLFGAARTAAPR
jgi:aerotaxis receptor